LDTDVGTGKEGDIEARCFREYTGYCLVYLVDLYLDEG
jgi:hypothetical protein